MKEQLKFVGAVCVTSWLVLQVACRAFLRFLKGESFVVALDSEAYKQDVRLDIERKQIMIAAINELESELDKLQEADFTAAAPLPPPGASAQTPAPTPVPPPPGEVNDRS